MYRERSNANGPSFKLNPEKLKKARTRKGFTQEKLAEKIGCNPKTCYRAEKGEPINFTIAVEIATALGENINSLLLDRDPVMTAFTTADEAIEKALSEGGPYSEKEIAAVVGLLLLRYATVIGRKAEDADYGIEVIQAVWDTVKTNVSDFVKD